MTLLTKGDKLARQCNAEVAISLRRKGRLIVFQTKNFWLSKEEIVSHRPTIETRLTSQGPCISPSEVDKLQRSSGKIRAKEEAG